MNQASAKQLIEETNYLDNKILVFKDSSKNKFCKIVWKGYSATNKDQNDEDGTVRARLRDLMSGKEFSDDIQHVAELFPLEKITGKEECKKEILNLLDSDEKDNSKTISWITNSFENQKVVEDEVEELLTELWLESKVTKARFKADDVVVYNARK